MKKSITTIMALFCAILTFAQVGVGTVTPNSTLDVRGSVSTNYRAFTAATTATATDNLLVFTGTTATTITLPTAVGCDGRSYMIKNASTTGPTPVLTIATTSAQTIDGVSTWTLTAANATITVISNGSNWHITTEAVPGAVSSDWTQNGNTVASLKSLGTISNHALPFITNNTEKMRLTNTGSLGIATTAPNSTFDVRGSVSTNYRAFTGVTTATATDNLLVFTGTTATTITLPTAVGCDGRSYVVKNASTTGPTPVLTIATTASQTIEGLSSWTLTTANESITLISNGSNWHITTASTPGAANTNWAHDGNTLAAMKSIGTISNQSLPFITNNSEKMRLTNTGNLGVATTAPNSTFDVRGSLSTNYRAFTAATSATATDNLLVFTGTTATTITLPTAVGCDGRSYMVKNASTTGPTPALTIATTSAQTIDAAGSWSLTSVNETVTLISNGANWMVAAQSLPGGSGTNWSQNGNAVPSLKSIGTSSNFSLPFITNNTEKMRLTNTGSLGVGTSTFNVTNPEKLLVDAGATTSVNAIVGKGSVDSYLQLNIQNQSSGTSASSDVVATANNGDETTNYVDMGINGGSYTGGVMGAANDSYLYNQGNNFLIGTGTAAKSLVFMTGGTSQPIHERMRIDGTGNVGIGTTSPAYKLQVLAASNPLYLGGVQTGANTDSLVTINNGVVRKLHASALPGFNNAWSINGNAGTSSSSNFIGTTDAQALVIKENGTQVGRFEANSIALGNGATINNSTHSYAIGSTAVVGFNKTHAYAFGTGAAVNADSSFAMGIAAVANGNSSFAIGNGAAANNTNSLAIGKNAVTAYSITDAVAIGTNATANNSNSIAIGSNTVAAGKTVTNAPSAIAIGNNAVSNSTNAVVIGTGASTGYNLTNPISIGVNSLVNGNNGLALGNGANIGVISNATAIGTGASVSSTGNNSTAIGYNASATLANEIILGDRSNTALSVGIGTESFSGTNREKLLVDAGTTTSVNAIVGKGSIDSYLQLNIQNNSAGTSASSDVVATANNGNETSNYIDMGINGGNYTGGVMGGANDGYMYTMGNNFLMGTANASKALVFMTGGTTQATNERMRIDGTGNVGIGTNNPLYKLQVNAASNPLYLGGVQLGSATDSVLTIANGVVKKLHPTALPGSNYGWGITGNLGINPALNFLGTTDDKQMILKSNGQSYLEFGRRQTLGLTQGYTDYDDNDEKVTYVRSALQFEAPAANFYKPKMFTDANGNFRVKGSSAGTDYFEFGSTGTSNNGGFEFIIGDDGDEPILFKSYNYLTGMSEIMRLQSGRMAVGSNAFNPTNPEKLLIDAGVTTSYNLMTGKGSIDNYLQINVQNRSTGTSASSDLVATADNGSETINYIDMGVNSSGYNNTAIPVLNGINNTYLYGAGNDFVIGNLGNNKPIVFFTTPNATQANAAERMRIDGTGNVGIGTTAPTSTLQVAGSQALAITTKTATYTATASDYTIVCNNAGAMTVNLPAAAGCSGRVYVVKKISGAALNVTIDANAAETIDGAATRVLTTQYESVMIQSNGTSWYILTKN